MKWILARHLSAWAERIDARIRLSEIIAKLVRASVTNISAFRFPAGDSAQIPGYDGQLTAIPADMYREFLADGESVWEFGTTAGYYEKANEDYRKRTESPGESVDITQTTFVFVTPHVWSRDKPTLSEWVAQKRAEKRWKDVRVLDAVALENWFELCSAVAATIAREIIGNLPITGALSTDEFWKEYSTQFQPQLNEEVLLAGRQEQRQRMVQMLMGSGQVHRWQGDSLAEVLAFAIACIRKAESDVRNFLESRTLFIESKDAARQLADSPHLIFMVRGEAVPLAGRLSESQLFSAWPHRKDTWNYVESFGESITIKYWQSRFPWGLEGQDADVEYAVRRYLDANRAEFIVEGLYPKISSIPTSLILTTLDQFETRIASTPGILHKQALDFDLQQVFAILQARTDVSLAEIAMREYRFLPLLRDNIRHRSETRSLVLDQYMAENAEFYVGILCDVFRPTSERGKEKDPSTITQQQQLRAKFGWTLLEGFTRIPGLTDNQIDIAVLQKWVAEVKQFASEKDRLIISEHKIGSLLAHAPDDPKDSHWPHKGIRDCLEIWQADEIEQGMAIERLNMRGATWRDPKQGGKPEHDLAAQLRDSAHYLEKWPRTQKVLLSLAQSWEDFGNREDLRVRQEEMREG
jgi:hypothetical protein